jgi:hypothetical protein
MIVETKFNLGDNAFFLLDEKIRTAPIHRMDIQIGAQGIEYQYFFKVDDNFKIMRKIFTTAEELMASITNAL